jgi:hypothetical protein
LSWRRAADGRFSIYHLPSSIRRDSGGLQVTRTGVRVPGDEAVAAFRREYDARHAVRVPEFLEPQLLAWILARLDTAPFTECVHPEVDPPAVEFLMDDPALHLMLWSLFNDGRLFEAVRRLTGCDAIGCFRSRAYAFEPSPRTHDTWHSDADGNRLVALSLNVGGAYDGGILQIRHAASHALLHAIENTVAGDAVLFRIGEGLEHYVTPLTGTRRRVVVAGWFERTPAALDLFGRVVRGEA